MSANSRSISLLRRVSFARFRAQVKAVDGVSFTIREGETFGLVGESGSGKTTLGRCIVRGIEPTEGTDSGSACPMATRSISPRLDKKALRDVRKHFHMIFQDPYSSLDPRMSVLDIISEPIRNNKLLSDSRDIQDRVRELMDKVGLDIQHLNRYPHAFSGGQRQRIGIARSLAPSPLLIVCDEAVSALDVSIQAQILNLLEDLQEEFNLTFLFIAHDLSVVEHISDRVGCDVCRPISGAGGYRVLVCLTQTSVYRGAAFGGANYRPRNQDGSDCVARRSRQSGGAAIGLLLSPALPIRAGDMRRRSARVDAGRQRSFCRLSFR